MVVLEPSVAVGVLERSLRALMEREYAREYGSEWFARVTDEKQNRAVVAAQQQEAPRRKGVANVAPVGLQYLELLALIQIAKSHWGPLRPALGKQESTLPLLWRFYELRNPSQHSRELLPFERDLMSGIAGQIQNQVTLHMSSQDPGGAYYPQITAAHDSLGNAAVMGHIGVAGVAGYYGSMPAETILRIGDVVTFTAQASDPQGRDLRWWLTAGAREAAHTVAPSGGPVQLQFIVEEYAVSEVFHVSIYMAAEGAKYHRAGAHDHSVIFTYAVRPPDHP